VPSSTRKGASPEGEESHPLKISEVTVSPSPPHPCPPSLRTNLQRWNGILLLHESIVKNPASNFHAEFENLRKIDNDGDFENCAPVFSP
jgi:hypothetical protein